jgi:uncharacterized protein (DUF2164 family)
MNGMRNENTLTLTKERRDEMVSLIKDYFLQE